LASLIYLFDVIVGLMSSVGLYAVSPIPEVSPLSDKSASIDPLSALCQQISQGMSLLSSADEPFPNHNEVSERFDH
jgi:hypothetical protein